MSFGPALRGVYDCLRELEGAPSAGMSGQQRRPNSPPSSDTLFDTSYPEEDDFAVLGVVAVDPPAQLVDWTSMFCAGMTPLPFLALVRRDNQKDSIIQRLVRNPYSVTVVVRQGNDVNDNENNNENRNSTNSFKPDTLPSTQSEDVLHFQVWLARTIVKYIGALCAMTQDLDNLLPKLEQQKRTGVQKSKL